MAKWYEEWFDRAEYELVYSHRNDSEASSLLDTIEKLVAPQPGAKILDVGCGRGRHAIAMAQRGYKLTGIDLSEKSIAAARERARAENLDICFEVMDMRVPYCSGCFDGVVNLFTAFGYFESTGEHRQALSAMAQAIRPNGWFVQDFLNAPYVENTLIPFDENEKNGSAVRQRRWIEDRRINKKITLQKIGASNEQETTFTESVALLSLADFQSLYREVGLEIFATLGTYSGEEYTSQSPRLIILARNPT